jgi:universal stress protein A
MNIKKILFSTDFSHTGDAALAMATALARDSGATILIVHVEEPPAAYGNGEMYYGMMEPATEELKIMLKDVVPKDPNVAFEHRLISGDPATAISRLAESEGVDMIILGTHGRTGLMRAVMGSVAEAIVRHAACPVLTFKQPNK